MILSIFGRDSFSVDVFALGTMYVCMRIQFVAVIGGFIAWQYASLARDVPEVGCFPSCTSRSCAKLVRELKTTFLLEQPDLWRGGMTLCLTALWPLVSNVTLTTRI